MTKIVAQLDADGYYVGQVIADQDPLAPDSYLIPAGAVDAEIPMPVDGKRFRYENGSWVSEDVPAPPAPPTPSEPTPEQVQAAKVQIVQNHMDAAAQARGYDSIASAVTYAGTDVVPRFQQEGKAFLDWRSLVWEKCYEILDAVKAGTQPVPEDDALIAALPTLTLPSA